jgi:DNA-binding transcriptional LysR family regulator
MLPDWAPPWPEGLTVRKLPLPDPSLKRRVGLLWNRTSLRIAPINAFLEQAERVLRTQARGSKSPQARNTRL